MVKAAGAWGWQPYHLHVSTVLKSGRLNLLEPSGPVQACNGIALLYWGRQGHTTYIAGERGRIKEYSAMCDWITVAQNKFEWQALLWARKWNLFFSQKEGCISSQSDWRLLKNSVPSNLFTIYLKGLSVDIAIVSIELHENHATLNNYYLKKRFIVLYFKFMFIT